MTRRANRSSPRPRAARARPGALLLLATWTVGSIVGCIAPPPEPVPSWTDVGPVAYAPGEAEQRLWIDAAAAHEAVLASGDVLVDAELDAYLARVVDALYPADRVPPSLPAPSVVVVRSLGYTASVDPLGHVYVDTALLSIIRSEDELAALLGHELAHFLARDGLAGNRYADATDSTVHRMQYSRAQELAADRAGLALAEAAGYDPLAMRDFLALLESTGASVRGPHAEWESHPALRARIVAVDTWEIQQRSHPERRRVRAYEAVVPVALEADAELALDAGRPQRARPSIERLVALRPDSGRARFLQGEMLRLTLPEGRAAPAVRTAYEEALALAPDDPDVLRALGLLLRDAGDDARARVLLARYVEVAPDAPDRRVVERYLAEP